MSRACDDSSRVPPAAHSHGRRSQSGGERRSGEVVWKSDSVMSGEGIRRLKEIGEIVVKEFVEKRV